MKKLMSYTMIALLATIAVSIAAPDKDEIMAKEKAAWQAFKDKDADAFKKLISSDLATVTSDGMHNLEQELDMMGKTEMKSFDLSDFNVTFPNPKTAIVTYKATVEATSEGKDASGTYNVGSVWQMAKGEVAGSLSRRGQGRVGCEVRRIKFCPRNPTLGGPMAIAPPATRAGGRAASLR